MKINKQLLGNMYTTATQAYLPGFHNVTTSL